MENLKLPVTVIGVVVLQIGGFIWWTAQQAATIADLEENVSQLSSRMAIEDNINLKRDVIDNAMEINHLWDEADDLWSELDGMLISISAINGIKQRIAIIENEIKYINRDHGSMIDMKGGMK
jgi:hypothetical protein